MRLNAALSTMVAVAAGPESTLRKTNMEPEYGEAPPKVKGCRAAGCRSFDKCICVCKHCRRWCKYRGIRIEEKEDVVNIWDAEGKLIVFIPVQEYEQVRHLWERFL